MEKYLSNYISNMGLISKTNKKLMTTTTTTKTRHQEKNIVKKWLTGLNREFSKDETQLAKKHRRKCSISLVIRKTQIKTSLRLHLGMNGSDK